MHKLLLVRNVQKQKINPKIEQNLHATGRTALKKKNERKSAKMRKMA